MQKKKRNVRRNRTAVERREATRNSAPPRQNQNQGRSVAGFKPATLQAPESFLRTGDRADVDTHHAQTSCGPLTANQASMFHTLIHLLLKRSGNKIVKTEKQPAEREPGLALSTAERAGIGSLVRRERAGIGSLTRSHVIWRGEKKQTMENPYSQATSCFLSPGRTARANHGQGHRLLKGGGMHML